jgi:hypothetical protein
MKLKKIFFLYKGKGHSVDNVEFLEDEDKSINTLLADNEFQTLRDDVENEGVQVHVVTKNEHVPEIERQNRVIKERARAIIQTLPYTDLPKKIRIALMKYVLFWLNNTPKGGQDLSPREMIMGEQVLDCKNLCKLPFGAYVQVHKDRQVTNTMESRTTGAICLGSNNFNGGYSFYSLETSEIISRRNWTELPVPVDVISRFKEMSNDLYSNIDEIGDQEENETEYHQDENTFEDEIVRDNEEEKSQKGGDEGEEKDSTTNSSIDNQQPSGVNDEREYELVQDNEEERIQDEQDETNKKDHSEVNEEERLVEEEMNREESEVNIHPWENQEPNEINIKDQ